MTKSQNNTLTYLLTFEYLGTTSKKQNCMQEETKTAQFGEWTLLYPVPLYSPFST